MKPRISMITLGVRDLAAAVRFYEEGHGFAGFSLAQNVASEAEVDAVVNQAVAAGATLVKAPQKVFWGGYSGYFADPDGHLCGGRTQPALLGGPQRRPAVRSRMAYAWRRPGR